MKEDLHYQETDKAWRGAQEKSILFIEMLIYNFSKPSDIVLDAKAATHMWNWIFTTFFYCHFFYILWFMNDSTTPYNDNLYLGPSIKACLKIDRHIIALEDDELIFDALIAPLVPPPSPLVRRKLKA